MKDLNNDGNGLDSGEQVEAAVADGQPGESTGVAPEVESCKPFRRSGGPRTAEGKVRSSKNGTKYGIFSKELIIRSKEFLENESRGEYNRLLGSYVDYYGPEGPAEYHQLEIAVGALWRYRRLLRAEAAEILQRRRELSRLALDTTYSYIAKNESAPEKTRRIAKRQSEVEFDIYYRCGSIPGPGDLERLTKYETHLLRVHYRALSELERLQQIRFGEKVPPRLVVEVNNG